MKVFFALSAVEFLNFLVHQTRLHFLAPGSYARFRSVVQVPDYETIALSPMHAHAAAFLEFMMVGAAFGAIATVLCLIGVVRLFVIRERRHKLTAYFAAGWLFFFFILHSDTAFFSRSMLEGHIPYFFVTALVSVLRVLTFWSVISLFLSPNLIVFTPRGPDEE